MLKNEIYFTYKNNLSDTVSDRLFICFIRIISKKYICNGDHYNVSADHLKGDLSSAVFGIRKGRIAIAPQGGK